MVEVFIGAFASLVQTLFTKIDNKSFRIILSISFCFILAFGYNYFINGVSPEMIEKLITAYGWSQIVYNTLFNNKLVKNYWK